MYGQLETAGVGKCGDYGTGRDFRTRGGIESENRAGDGGDHLGGGQVLQRFLLVQLRLGDVQFSQFQLDFVGAGQQPPESELGGGEVDAGLLGCALQVFLVQREKEVTGVDSVADFDPLPL